MSKGVSGAYKGTIGAGGGTSGSSSGENSQINSVGDIVKKPKVLWGKSKSDVARILDNNWTEGAYGSKKTGWKFTNEDQSIFYHPGGGRHVGEYYGYSSAYTGKFKVVGPDYKPTPNDKAIIIKV